MRLHRATSAEGVQLKGRNTNMSNQQLLESYNRAYSRPELNGIRGELRTPNGQVNLGLNLSPSEVLQRLMNWHRASPAPTPRAPAPRAPAPTAKPK